MEHFRQHRYPTTFPVRVNTTAGPVEGTVLNVNQLGLRINLGRGLKRGERITMTVMGHPVAAVVRWSAGSEIGASFEPHLSPALVDAFRAKGLAYGAQLGHHSGLQEMR